MLALAKSGTTVWWRREGFHEEPFRDNEPKWHVLTGRFTHRNNPEMLPISDPVWAALCGYRKDFDERIFEEFPRLTKRAPKVATRCRKCVSELPAYLERRAAERAEKAARETQPETNEAEQP
jgi:hypothetical protein